MFFDKCYRPDRYATICNKIDDYQNINDFRSRVMLNYHNYPANSTRSLYLLYKSDEDKELDN